MNVFVDFNRRWDIECVENRVLYDFQQHFKLKRVKISHCRWLFLYLLPDELEFLKVAYNFRLEIK